MVIENMNKLELRGRDVMTRSSRIEWRKTFPREILAPWWGMPKGIGINEHDQEYRLRIKEHIQRLR